MDSDDEYRGKSDKKFHERLREHLKASTLIDDQQSTTGHTTTLDNFNIVGREEQNFVRTIKESHPYQKQR